MVTNGNIPDSQLVTGIQGWAKLWPSTAAKFAAMNADLVAHGYPLMVITTLDWAGAYRSVALQRLMKVKYGVGAATPGYSNHGLGRAWDINNISHYPARVIPTYAAKHGLRIDAGNGHGGIESWHMHDADGIMPAGSSPTPIISIPTTPTESDDDNMKVWYCLDNNGIYFYTLVDTDNRVFDQVAGKSLDAAQVAKRDKWINLYCSTGKAMEIKATNLADGIAGYTPQAWPFPKKSA